MIDGAKRRIIGQTIGDVKEKDMKGRTSAGVPGAGTRVFEKRVIGGTEMLRGQIEGQSGTVLQPVEMVRAEITVEHLPQPL